jgi:hypothetical protein
VVDGFSKYGFGAALDEYITPAYGCRGLLGRRRSTCCWRIHSKPGVSELKKGDPIVDLGQFCC